VFNAVLSTKLLYGLESMIAPVQALKRLDTFQLKGLRKILNIKTTFIDRTQTNNKIYEDVNKLILSTDQFVFPGDEFELFRAKKIEIPVIPLSVMLAKKRVKLLGHIIRHPDSPMFRNTFMNGSLMPNIPRLKRAGRPRLHWAEETMKQSWRYYYRANPADNVDLNLNIANQNHLLLLKQWAINRNFPFDTEG
jgi:hypothetical protein